MKSSHLAKLICSTAFVSMLWGAAPAALAADYPTTVTGLGPLVYYRLNDAASSIQFADVATNLSSLGAAGNAYYLGDADTTYTHPVTTGLIGSMTAAASFANGHVDFPFDASFNGMSFAAEMWYNISASGGALCASINFDGRYGWIVYTGQDGTDAVSLRGYSGNGGGSTPHWTIATPGPVTTGAWHHLVVQSDGTTASLYIDGALVGTNLVNPYNPPTPAAACPFCIMGRGDGNFQAQGMAAQVAIYTNALTAAQITAHYNTGLAANPSPSYASVVLSDGALAYWPLNDGAFTIPDPSTYPVAVNKGTLGTAGNGTYLPGTKPGVAGPGFAGLTAGGACHFNSLSSWDDGSSETNLPGYVDIGAAGGIGSATITSAITLMAWIQRDAWFADYTTILCKGNTSWRLQRGPSGGNTSDLQFGLNDNTSGAAFFGIAGGNANINDSLWHHVVAVYDGTNDYLYFDGVLDTMLPASGRTINSTADLASIGENTGSQGRVWYGDIAEVAIFDKALTAAQVTAVYNSAQAPPYIVVEPQITPPVYAGSTVSLDVQAAGATPLSYQWTSNSVRLSGQTGTNLTLTGVTPAFSGTYAVVVSNVYGTVTSTPAALTIQNTKPVIFTQPSSFDLAVGGTATFTVVAGGTTPITYQWSLNGTAIPGATLPTLVISPIMSNDFGSYTVLLANSLGTSNSQPAVLTQFTPPNAYAAAVMALNPFIYYPMNSTNGGVAPDIASGLDGAIKGSMAIGAGATGAGFAGTHNAFQFDGTATTGTAYIDCGTFNPNPAAQTFIAWVNQSSTINQKAIICKQNDSFRMQSYNSEVEFTEDGTYPGTDQWRYFLQGTIGDATWHMLVGSLDNGVKSFYEDGALLLSADVGGLVAVTPEHVYIGENSGLGAGYWNGLISDVAVFNRGLSGAEVSNLWQVATAGPSAPGIGIPPASRTVTYGQPVTFTVAPTGSAPFTYQWRRNGAPISGNTIGGFTIPSAGYGDSGSYDVVVNNGVGPAVTSAAATLAVVPPARYANLTNGLVLHLPLDGNYNDTSGRNNNASPSASAPTFVPGKIGSQAVQVSSVGTFRYVTVPYSTDFAFGPAVPFFGGNGGTDFSVSFWANYTGLPNDLPMIGSAVNSTYQHGWVFTDDHGSPEWWLYASDDSGARSADPVPGSPITDDGNWHNIVLTVGWSNNMIATYVDGIQVFQTPTGIMDSVDALNNIVLGNDPSGTYSAAGTYSLDDVGIWNRALSEVEAESIYYAGQNGRSFDVAGPGTLAIGRAGSQVVVTWAAGTLQSAPAVTGPWAAVTGAAAPTYFAMPTAVEQFYRVKF